MLSLSSQNSGRQIACRPDDGHRNHRYSNSAHSIPPAYDRVGIKHPSNYIGTFDSDAKSCDEYWLMHQARTAGLFWSSIAFLIFMYGITTLALVLSGNIGGAI